ncbi:unnamed protein product [Euphydryas editha]|uniref:tRNA (adenine(58)-N(1))-methyltransferase n=1 Tax=Euphydryas editha TaxID=104508 RepID=A0AAU9UBP5_EUPED|nr:unnamed protein product [Euphydryas editha]
MSFRHYKDKIDEGDVVILYLSNNLHAIEVKPEIKNKKGEMVENVYQTTFGALKVRNLIGSEYGSRVELSKGWGHVLQPTPELWSLTLPHRTQIIYTPDISMILLQLDLVPGSVVIEAGTGSGSLTHGLIRRIRPHGHVYTFDFHDHRAKVAQEEFESHGLSDFVTARHRDILAEGFGDDLIGKADAVFLDLPSPWSGVPHAVTAIKSDGLLVIAQQWDSLNITIRVIVAMSAQVKLRATSYYLQRHAHSTKRAFNDTQALLLALTKCPAVIAAFSTLTNVWSRNMTYQCNRDLSHGGLDAERTKV